MALNEREKERERDRQTDKGGGREVYIYIQREGEGWREGGGREGGTERRREDYTYEYKPSHVQLLQELFYHPCTVYLAYWFIGQS